MSDWSNSQLSSTNYKEQSHDLRYNCCNDDSGVGINYQHVNPSECCGCSVHASDDLNNGRFVQNLLCRAEDSVVRNTSETVQDYDKILVENSAHREVSPFSSTTNEEVCVAGKSVMLQPVCSFIPANSSNFPAITPCERYDVPNCSSIRSLVDFPCSSDIGNQKVNNLLDESSNSEFESYSSQCSLFTSDACSTEHDAPKEWVYFKNALSSWHNPANGPITGVGFSFYSANSLSAAEVATCERVDLCKTHEEQPCSTNVFSVHNMGCLQGYPIDDYHYFNFAFDVFEDNPSFGSFSFCSVSSSSDNLIIASKKDVYSFSLHHWLLESVSTSTAVVALPMLVFLWSVL